MLNCICFILYKISYTYIDKTDEELYCKNAVKY